MTDLISYVIRGIPFGCVFALVAVGLVLTYRTSGVFNLAFGAQAFVSAAVYYDTRVRHEWPIIPAFVLAVVDRRPARRLHPRSLHLPVHADRLGAVAPRCRARPPRRHPADGAAVVRPEPELRCRRHLAVVAGQRLRGVPLGRLRARTATRSPRSSRPSIVGVGLTAMFRYSSIGLRMRAVVESPRMTELNGINADRIGTFAWMLSSLIAGLAGVLLAPLFAQVSANNFTILIVAALAAAAFGKLSSIPLTLLGGIALGHPRRDPRRLPPDEQRPRAGPPARRCRSWCSSSC